MLLLTASAPGNVVCYCLDVFAIQRVPEQVGGTVAAIPLVGSVVAVSLAVAVQLLSDTEPRVIAHKVPDAAGQSVWLVVVNQVRLNGQRCQNRGAES